MTVNSGTAQTQKLIQMRIYQIGLILLTGLFGCNQISKPISSDTGKSPDMAKVKLVALDGQPIQLEQYLGKTIFINFWATWCKPCVEEMPSIAKAKTILNDTNIVFLLASSESIEEIKTFSSNHNDKLNYVHLENGEALDIQALPTTFIINPKGRIVFSEMGLRIWDETPNINLIKNITNQHD